MRIPLFKFVVGRGDKAGNIAVFVWEWEAHGEFIEALLARMAEDVGEPSQSGIIIENPDVLYILWRGCPNIPKQFREIADEQRLEDQEEEQLSFEALNLASP